MHDSHAPQFAVRTATRTGRRRWRVAVVEVSGELDVASRDRCYRHCTDAGPHVVVDLGELAFLDAAGFRALERARADLERDGGSLVWRGATGEPARFLQVIGGRGAPAGLR